TISASAAPCAHRAAAPTGWTRRRSEACAHAFRGRTPWHAPAPCTAGRKRLGKVWRREAVGGARVSVQAARNQSIKHHGLTLFAPGLFIGNGECVQVGGGGGRVIHPPAQEIAAVDEIDGE